MQGSHLIHICEAGQGGSQGLTEALSFLPGALPAQPFLVEHLGIQTRSDEETGRRNVYLSDKPQKQRHTNDKRMTSSKAQLLMGSNMHTHLVAVFNSGSG